MRKWVVLLVAFVGCATAPLVPLEQVAEQRAIWDEAAKVTITINPDQLTECSVAGSISRTFESSYPSDPDGRVKGDWTENYLRVEAARMGANAVLRVAAPQRAFPGGPPVLVGEAYVCP